MTAVTKIQGSQGIGELPVAYEMGRQCPVGKEVELIIGMQSFWPDLQTRPEAKNELLRGLADRFEEGTKKGNTLINAIGAPTKRRPTVMATKAREKRERRKVSARERAEKHTSGFDRTSLHIPDGVSLFSIKDVGTYRVDIIPYQVKGNHNPWQQDGELHWERTYWTHRNVGPNRDTYVCATKSFGKKCAVCDELAKMSRDPDHDPQIIKDMAPKERQLFNVIDLNNKDKGVQIWDISYHLFGKALESMIRGGDDGEYDFFADLEEGKTLKLNVEKRSLGAGQPFSEVAGIEFKDRKEPYDEDILEQVHCLDELIKEVPYDKLKAVFLQIGDDEEDDDDDEDEDESPRKPSKADAGDDNEDDDDEPAPKKANGKKKPPVDEDEDDEDTDDEDEDDDEDEPAAKKPPAKGQGPAHKAGLKVGMAVKHKKYGLCEISHISPDGTSLRIEDEDGDEHKAIAVKEVTVLDPEDDEDEDDAPPPKRSGGKGKPAAGKRRPKDEDDDEDEDEDEDD